MECGAILLAISLIILWILYDKFLKSGGVRDFTQEQEYESKGITFKPLQNADKKPDIKYIGYGLSEERSALLKIIIVELEKIGTPELFWRGDSNGWVLSIVEDEAQHGSFILTKEIIIGQTWSRNFGIVPTKNRINFDEIPLTSKDDVTKFINILKLKMGIIET